MGLLRGKKYPKVRVVGSNRPAFFIEHPIVFLYVIMGLVIFFVAVID